MLKIKCLVLNKNNIPTTVLNIQLLEVFIVTLKLTLAYYKLHLNSLI